MNELRWMKNGKLREEYSLLDGIPPQLSAGRRRGTFETDRVFFLATIHFKIDGY